MQAVAGLVRARTTVVATAIAVAALYLPATAGALPTPLGSFGSVGSAAGQLNGPNAVAIDGSGNIYVAEQVNNRISVFTAGGTFVRAFGRGVLTGGTSAETCTTATSCQ